MNPLLFEKDAIDFSTRGLYSLPDAISCVVTEERNGEYELAMEYPIDGAYFNEILEDRILVAVPHQNGTKQAFRIYRREVDLEGVTTFFARHISYQLNFIPVDLVSGQTSSAQTMMEDIAAAAQGTQPFSFWSDISTLSPLDWEVTAPSGLRAALGGQEGSVLDTFGGEFEWDNWTVKLHEHRGADNGVKISYGKNLTELSDALDIGDTITGVMAYYQYDDAGVIRTVYTSPKVLNLPANPYAHERIIPLDCSDKFTDPPTQVDLTLYATAWLNRTANADPVNELTIAFVPLGQTTEYSYDEDLDSVHLCDTVHIRYPAIGLETSKQVTRTEWDVLSERYNEVTLGEEASLADTIVELQNGESSSSHGQPLTDMNFVVRSATASAHTVTANNVYDWRIPVSSFASPGKCIGLTGVSLDGTGVSQFTIYRFYYDTFAEEFIVSARNRDTQARTLTASVVALFLEV